MLAEANQWPTDVRTYFGDGDECHMAFHFPLMPRIYMALRQEDRLPITDIMAQTPDIPDNCQWGLFLRNHDELTLEMVTDDERDYMYLAYSADPRMRINIGIRRRLAPLLDNNRRRIELLNSILFSFPGTPILYYGDEIGMGDNIYLGDRNGVRTPMQWTGSQCRFLPGQPRKALQPGHHGSGLGLRGLNVEAQQNDPSSLLNWMRNMIALRKLFQVFGRGSLAFLDPSNRKILAYIRQYKNEKVLCVANLSRFAQPVELDLAAYGGMVPVEMLGYVEFPRITTAYPLTVGPYGFLWLELQPSPEPAPSLAEEGEPEIEVSGPTDWMSVLEGNGRRELEETVLRGYLARQRWFGAKSRPITGTRIEDWAVFNQGMSALVWVEVQYAEGDSDTYLVTLGLLFGKAADALREESPNALLARLTSAEGDGVLHEGIFNDTASEALLALISGGGKIPSREGDLLAIPSSALAQLQGEAGDHAAPRRGSAEQSNTSILFGDKLIMKLFRRQQFGPNPDTEIGRYLTETTHFTHIAPFGGSIQYTREGQEPSTVAMLQGLVTNEGDGWQWTLEELDRYYEASAAHNFAQAGIDEGPTSLLQLSQAHGNKVRAGTCGYLPRRRSVAGQKNGGDAPRSGIADARPGVYARTPEFHGPRFAARRADRSLRRRV